MTWDYTLSEWVTAHCSETMIDHLEIESLVTQCEPGELPAVAAGRAEPVTQQQAAPPPAQYRRDSTVSSVEGGEEVGAVANTGRIANQFAWIER